MERQFVSPRQFAEITGRNEAVVRRKCCKGEITAVKFGRCWLIPYRVIERMGALDRRQSWL